MANGRSTSFPTHVCEAHRPFRPHVPRPLSFHTRFAPGAVDPGVRFGPPSGRIGVNPPKS
eukprot:scaffold80_cov325-Pavlova_lutheri.AAC.52